MVYHILRKSATPYPAETTQRCALALGDNQAAANYSFLRRGVRGAVVFRHTAALQGAALPIRRLLYGRSQKVFPETFGSELASDLPRDVADHSPLPRHAFRHMPPEAREESIADVVANALTAFIRLVDQGQVELAFPTVLAKYGIAQHRCGRRVGVKLNVKNITSPYCRAMKGIVVQRLDRFDDEE